MSQTSANAEPTKKNCGPDLPAVDCDLLYGIAAIARWMGMTRSKVKPLIEGELIPTFRPPGRSVRCALKTRLNAAFNEWANRRPRGE